MSEVLEQQIAKLKRRYEREKQARKSAENLLDDKSRELYDVNQSLEKAQANLELQVEEAVGNIQRRDGYMQMLLRVMSNTAKPVKEQLVEALQLAAAAFAADRAIINEIDVNHIKIRHFYSFDGFGQVGQRGYLEGSLSELTIKEDGIFIIRDFAGTPYEERVKAQPFATKSYIGIPIIVHGDIFGVLSIGSGKPLEAPFESAEHDFLTGMARWVGSALERELAEDALKIEQAETRKLSYVASGTDNMVVITDPDGHIEWVNDSFERVTGYTYLDVLDRRPGDMLQGPETDPNVVAYMRSQLRKKLGFECEVLNYTKSGEPYWVSLEVKPVHDDDGTLRNFIAIEADITKSRAAEKAIIEAKEEAEQANLAKSQFLANMSHEIRTPMNAIIGMAGLLIDSNLPPEQGEFADTIRTAGENLLTIINEILDFSKIEAGKMDIETMPFNVRSCVEEALDLVTQPANEKGVELVYFIEPSVPQSVVGDVTRLRQVLLNLLGNAVKFTEAGEVVINVKAKAETASSWRLFFSIRDTGIGIPPERVSGLFQAFTQVDASTTRRYGGTGLGLVISRRICELMGGSIDVQSEVGAGSTFNFNILVDHSAENVPSNPIPNGNISNKRVLIVDDNETNRTILLRYTTVWGMVPDAASSGFEALHMLMTQPPYDVAILDVHMPEMDGIELVRRIQARQQTKDLPIIVLSSTGRSEVGASDLQVEAYLNKPLKPSVLIDALAKLFSAETDDSEPQSHQPTKQFDMSMAKRHPLQILLAEDNRVNQLVATKMLERLGYRADIAANGYEVITALERQFYDVVLMDVQMPEMDGVEATQQIIERYSADSRPYIIAVTANALAGDRERYLAYGMNDYVSKPIRVKELISALEAAPTKATGQTLVFDREQTVSQLGEDFDDLFSSLVPMFYEDVNAHAAKIEAAIAGDDNDTIWKEAHAIKGASASLGAAKLADISGELEQAAKEKQYGDIQTLFLSLLNAIQLTFADPAFKKWLS